MRRLLGGRQAWLVCHDCADTAVDPDRSLPELRERRARFVAATAALPQALGATRQRCERFAKRRAILVEGRGDIGVDIVRRSQRAYVLADSLRERRELRCLLHVARRSTGLQHLLAGLLRKLGKAFDAVAYRLVALRDSGDRRLAADDAVQVAVHAFPARLDRLQDFSLRRIGRCAERHAANGAAVQERIEIFGKALAALACGGQRPRLTLCCEHAAACDALRQHLHVHGGRKRRRLLRCSSSVQIQHVDRKREKGDQQKTEHLNLLSHRQVTDDRQPLRLRRRRGRRFHLIHDRHRRERVVARRRLRAHLDLGRWIAEVRVGQLHDLFLLAFDFGQFHRHDFSDSFCEGALDADLQERRRTRKLPKIDLLPRIAFVVHPALRVPFLRVGRHHGRGQLSDVAKSEHPLHDDAGIQLAGACAE